MATTRASYTVGILYRGDFRRAIIRFGLEWHEDKGWLDSQFTVWGEPTECLAFHKLAERWAAEINRL